MNLIGMMQGRLSPPNPDRLQGFPWENWEKEFQNAHECQIDLIEWLFDADHYEQNPIWLAEGIRAIQRQIATSGTGVQTCCAGYFMPHPFFRVTEEERRESIRVLSQLIRNSAQMGIHTILVPVLEICEIRTAVEKEQLLDSLQAPLKIASQEGINLGMETELSASEYLSLVEEGASPNLGVYYDTGNATAQGHDIVADARLLVSRMVGIHVKDRKRHGPNVFLGEGDVDFDGFFKVVMASGYIHPVIMETKVGPDYLGTARRHRQFVGELILRLNPTNVVNQDVLP